MNYCFESDFTVNSHDCDINNVLRPSGVLRYLQETANLHIEHVNYGYDFCKSMGRAFVLSRVAVTLHAPIFAYEEIRGRTWACDSKAMSFNRCSQLLKGNQCVAELSSSWALLNFENQTLVRVADSGLDLPYGKQLTHSAPMKFRIPSTLLIEPVGKFSVGYSVCDRNHHMNNTRYPDLLCDFLPSLEGKRLSELSISYMNEAHLGEKVSVFRGQDADGVWFFRTIRRSDGKTGIEARISFTDL